MPGRIALDIETVSPTLDPYEKPPDFRDSAHFELLAVCLGYEAPDGTQETAMCFREGTDPESELDLVERTCDWIEARVGANAESVPCLTYGGDGFDLPHLLGRTETASDAIAEATRDEPTEAPTDEPSQTPINGSGDLSTTADRLDRLLGTTLDHVDVQPAVWDAFGEYTRLEEACDCVGIETDGTYWASFDHGIDLDELRPTAFQGFETVINKDIPVLGDRYLNLAAVEATDTVTFRALHDLLDHYGREDVVHLFDLADARPFEEE